MKREQGTYETHILVMPHPLQGHINPMLQFSKRLASKGLKVTLINIITSINNYSLQAQVNSIDIKSISSGFQEGEQGLSFDEYRERFKLEVSKNLAKFVEEQNSSKNPPKILIYDSFMPWALDIAQNLGVDGAPFFTQSWAVNAIYYHLNQELLKVPLEVEEPMLSLPSFPPLSINDLPSFVSDSISYSSLLKECMNQFSNFKQANWVFCNTFDKLEDEVMKSIASQRAIKNIGPMVPSMYVDKRLEDDKDYGLNLFKPNIDVCMKWLVSKEPNSVVYVSFGSLASPREEQMKELASGLKMSGSYFLWVVKESEKKNFPENFAEETEEKGLIVNWSPQLEVLAHKSVGCFMTHCGWNSTLEALSLGVPMVAMPLWADQPTNAKFVEDVWNVGIRVKVDEKGIVKREEIELSIREIMKGERGREIKRNLEKWKELAREAVDEEGSSDKNIEEFVAELACI